MPKIKKKAGSNSNSGSGKPEYIKKLATWLKKTKKKLSSDLLCLDTKHKSSIVELTAANDISTVVNIDDTLLFRYIILSPSNKIKYKCTNCNMYTAEITEANCFRFNSQQFGIQKIYIVCSKCLIEKS